MEDFVEKHLKRWMVTYKICSGIVERNMVEYWNKTDDFSDVRSKVDTEL